MAITLQRKPFTPAQREIVIEAVMTGRCAYSDDLPGLEEIALEIADSLPKLLRHAGLPDNSENRRKVIDLILIRWAMPKAPRRSRSYRRMAARR